MRLVASLTPTTNPSPLSQPGLLTPGAVLLVPTAGLGGLEAEPPRWRRRAQRRVVAAARQAVREGGAAVVDGGDSLGSLARRFGTTPAALAALNGLDPAGPCPLHAGDLLRVRPPPAAAPERPAPAAGAGPRGRPAEAVLLDAAASGVLALLGGTPAGGGPAAGRAVVAAARPGPRPRKASRSPRPVPGGPPTAPAAAHLLVLFAAAVGSRARAPALLGPPARRATTARSARTATTVATVVDGIEEIAVVERAPVLPRRPTVVTCHYLRAPGPPLLLRRDRPRLAAAAWAADPALRRRLPNPSLPRLEVAAPPPPAWTVAAFAPPAPVGAGTVHAIAVARPPRRLLRLEGPAAAAGAPRGRRAGPPPGRKPAGRDLLRRPLRRHTAESLLDALEEGAAAAAPAPLPSPLPEKAGPGKVYPKTPMPARAKRPRTPGRKRRRSRWVWRGPSLKRAAAAAAGRCFGAPVSPNVRRPEVARTPEATKLGRGPGATPATGRVRKVLF